MALDINHIESEIIDQYMFDENYSRPWIIGFSGGKDSTMLLQVVWNALKKIPREERRRDVYVVCNDTMVENPHIVTFIEKTLKKIQKAAPQQGLPITVHKTMPRLEDTFWVRLIGRGYPAPNNIFRWCTERLKINPTTRFILDKISERGEAIILLGTRSAESSNRAKSIKKHEIKGQRLRKHMLQNAYVYAPIKDVETNELWQYLMQVPSPWGANNKELVTLYKNANSGDCPLVIDDTTPSCGNSRFGCWVCTVVKRDKSMEGLIENGEEWMWPLVEIRDILAESRDNESMREKAGRDGVEREGRLGPYTAESRALFLEKVLKAQKEIQESQGNIDLITHQELVAIQLQWYRDGLFNNNVSSIYNKIYKTNINMSKHDEKFKKEEELLKTACDENPEDFELIQQLLILQKTKTLMAKKRGLQSDLENRIEDFVKVKKKK